MFAFMSHPSFMPCADCGASVKREELAEHECDAERKLDHQLLLLAPRSRTSTTRSRTYLDSPCGPVQRWYAEHRRTPLQER
jgi:hypothetical protein